MNSLFKNNNLNHLNQFRLVFLSIFLFYQFSSSIVFAQFNVVGSAAQTGGNCYQLTPNNLHQAGAIWNLNQINLNQSFDITLNMNFGCDDGGGDGMSFILQPSNTIVAATGVSCGYGGIGTSLGVVFDTYPNAGLPVNSTDPLQDGAGDPPQDHVSIHSNGYIRHTTNTYVGGAVVTDNQLHPPVVLPNIEDCTNHIVRFTWNPITHTFSVYLDGTLYISLVNDIVATIFGGNPLVYWGVGAATGAATNQNTCCISRYADFDYSTSCFGQPVFFTDNSVSDVPIAHWFWDFGDGQTSSLQNPSHIYSSEGTYTVLHKIFDASNNIIGTTSKTVIVSKLVVEITTPSTSVCSGPITLNGTINIVPSDTFETKKFTNYTDYPIVDGGVTPAWDATITDSDAAYSPVNASGLLPGWKIDSIVVSANISRIPQEGRIYIQDPCGNIKEVFKGAYTNTIPSGGLNGNFVNTCFTPYSTTNLLSLTTTPTPSSYTNKWASTGGWIWSTLEGCSNPNGTWTLIVGDRSNTGLPWTQYLTEWSIYFSNPISPNITYNWQPDNITNTLSPTVNPTSTGYYYLNATDSHGCIGRDSVLISLGSGGITTSPDTTICIGSNVTLSALGATSYIWSTTQTSSSITVSPIVTTTYTVTATGAGCTSIKDITVTISSGPTINVNSATICSGDSVLLTATGATSYVWNTTPPQNSATIIVSPNMTTTYSVTGSIGSCSATSSGTVTVGMAPTSTITTNSPICAGNTLSLSVPVSASYNWAGPNGFSSHVPVPLIPTASAINSGLYCVTVTSVNGCTSSACENISVGSALNIIVSNDTICIGDTATLIASGANSYTWNVMPNVSGSQLTISPNITTTYTVVGTNGLCNATGSGTIVVRPLPLISINTNSPICEGNTLNLTANGGLSYLWIGPNGFSSNIQNPSIINSNNLNNGQYFVTATDVNLCSATANVNVQINQFPSLALTAIPVCAGNSANISASGATNYLWSNGHTTSTISVNPMINTMYYITGTNGGCSTTDSILQIVNALPRALFTPSTNSGCGPLEVTFTNISPGLISSYFWDLGNGVISENENPSTTYTNAGNYIVSLTVTDENGCVSIPESQNIQVSEVFAIIQTNNQAINVGAINDFLSQSEGANTWLWNMGDGSLFTTENVTYSYNHEGVYSVVLIVQNNFGCIDSAIVNISVNQDYVIYIPNTFTPNRDGINEEFLVNGAGIVNASFKLTIYDRWGKELFISNSINDGWSGKSEDGVDYPENTYIYIVEFRDTKKRTHSLVGNITLIR